MLRLANSSARSALVAECKTRQEQVKEKTQLLGSDVGLDQTRGNMIRCRLFASSA